MDVVNWSLCEVVHYCASSNGIKVHVSCLLYGIVGCPLLRGFELQWIVMCIGYPKWSICGEAGQCMLLYTVYM